MPNASELARREEELANAVARVNNLDLGKAQREAALREVRTLERELGVEAIGNINQPSAQEQQDEVLVASTSIEENIITYDQLKAARNVMHDQISLTDVGVIMEALRRADNARSRGLLARFAEAVVVKA